MNGPVNQRRVDRSRSIVRAGTGLLAANAMVMGHQA
jgi:hypothetical protein